jgi:polyhydroxyalkanoate synthesis regulator phasin
MLPAGTKITNTTTAPSEGDRRFEWVPDENKTFDKLDPRQIFNKQKYVKKKYKAMLKRVLRKLKLPREEADVLVRKLLRASDQECLDFSNRFPHNWLMLTSELADDPIQQEHDGCMLELFRQLESGEVSADRAKQLAGELTKRTIMRRTDALPERLREQMKTERSAAKERFDAERAGAASEGAAGAAGAAGEEAATRGEPDDPAAPPGLVQAGKKKRGPTRARRAPQLPSASTEASSASSAPAVASSSALSSAQPSDPSSEPAPSASASASAQ